MAKATQYIINLLNATAGNLEKSADYQWGHMGLCNCGFLVQQVTQLQKREIHKRAMQRYGDWNEQLNDYCPTSGLLIDDIISEMFACGFDMNDLKHLERLSDKRILDELPGKNLKHNVKEDVVLYIRTWAHLLEEKMIEDIKIPAIENAVEA